MGTTYLADPTLRAEYEAEIAPRTAAALRKILAEIWPARDGVRRALDLGSGTGAAGAALREHFGSALEVVAVDRVAAPGVVVCDLAGNGAARPAGVSGSFDVVVAAHLLNELGRDIDWRAQRVLAWARELLAPGGAVVLVEPALRATSRDLLEVRDRVVRAGLHVQAPCLWTGPCPALARERDWCHDAAAGPAGPRVDFSYLVLRCAGEPARDPALFRIVSDVRNEKGRRRVFGCGPSGRHALVLLRRDRGPNSARFENLERGQVAWVAPVTPAADGLRLGAETLVELKPSSSSQPP